MESQNKLPLVGITGGIGAGKTIVCRIFAALGIPVFNADEQAKRLVNNDLVLKESIVELLGDEAFLEGKYNRKYVAKQVFNNPVLLSKLNGLIHPEVRKAASTWAEKQAKSPYLLYEAALMNRAGEGNKFQKIIVVNAPMVIRIERIKTRDHRTEAEIKAIIDKQISDETRNKIADFRIENNEKESLIEQVLKIDEELRNFQ